MLSPTILRRGLSSTLLQTGGNHLPEKNGVIIQKTTMRIFAAIETTNTKRQYEAPGDVIIFTCQDLEHRHDYATTFICVTHASFALPHDC